jgi:hypothetical protein
MASERDSERLDLSGVAVSAELLSDGRLEAIGGVLPKLLAARLSKAARGLREFGRRSDGLGGGEWITRG